MTSSDIRNSFLDFFKSKQHTIVRSSPLAYKSRDGARIFTNAGMNQFVPIFLGEQKPDVNKWGDVIAKGLPTRAADTQKCIRATGKHNDLEDVGLDTYHHTFFEMLGNWSFGDYFKKEAIEWAWELVVDRWKFPPQRLYATVYKPGSGEPSEFDQEAHDHWTRLFQDADLDPAVHVINGGKADNFWMMGDTGPCGPCSELHVDLTPDGDTRGALVNAGDPRCIEIWNLVFIQFNANPDGSFVPLPQRHVDTGMGFERVTAIIQGTKNFTDFSGIVSNYETDVFRPIFDEIEKLSGKKYGSTLPDSSQLSTLNPQQATDVAFRVIADHIRTLSFAIADGIIPSNDGRGYVLRRILRRAVRYGRTLGFHEPFFFKLVDVVAKTMGDVFREVRTQKSKIVDTIKNEEEAFNKTLDRGIEIFYNALITAIKDYSTNAGLGEKMVLNLGPHYTYIEGRDRPVVGEFTNVHSLETKLPQVDIDVRIVTPTQLSEILRGSPIIRGKDAFELYDTYGFPFDLTELMARERGMKVDRFGFDRLMEDQRTRARKSQKREVIDVFDVDDSWNTTFVGYKTLAAESEVVGRGKLASKPFVIFKETPFYADMGGQIGDTGQAIQGERIWHIHGTQKKGLAVVHFLDEENAPDLGETIQLKVDDTRRHAIERHHTVTHVLHWALHEVVSRDATQKGSYVGPDKLTFDFASAALTPEQKRAVEKLVNEKISEEAQVSWTEIPYADAKERSDIQQFFGEKYGEAVRVVQIGGDAKALNGYSMELCGGTHVESTGEIKSFRIVKEEAIAAGIRRIEAVAGDALIDWAEREAARQQEKFEMLSRKKADLKALPDFRKDGKPDVILGKIDNRAAHLEKLEAEVRDWEKQSAKSAGAELQSRAATIATELAASHAANGSLVAEVPDADGKLLGAVVEALKGKFNGPIFLAGVSGGRVALIASVPKGLTAKFQANKLIQEIAPIVGGKGGGRPENAQGAGSDASKVNEALAKARSLLD